MSDVDELVAWLREQLDEDEKIALAATPGPWRYDPEKHHHIVGTPLFEEAVFAGPSGEAAVCVAGTGETDDRQSMGDAAHIAEHDPARVLREVRAKREVIVEWESVTRIVREEGDGSVGVAAHALGVTLRLLVVVYSDRPGYRSEWQLADEE